MKLSDYRIEKVTKADCESFLKKHHYLSKQGCGFRYGKAYGLYDGDTLEGVAVFHTISAWQTVKGAFGLGGREQADFWELGRLAMNNGHVAPNATSWFLSRAIKRLRKETHVRALLAYADDDYHRGYIYQATNFAYYGLTDLKSDFYELLDDGTYKKVSRGSYRGKTGKRVPRSPKHRYLMVYDKSLTVLWEKQNYPKGDNTILDDSESSDIT